MRTVEIPSKFCIFVANSTTQLNQNHHKDLIYRKIEFKVIKFQMKNDKNAYLLLLFTFVTLATIVDDLVSKYYFGLQFWIGISLLGICILSYFLKLKKFKFVFGILLILGVFRIVKFASSSFYIILFYIPFEIIPIVFLLIFIYINKSRILDLLQYQFATTKEEMDRSRVSKYENFKKGFECLSDKEIENRLNQVLVPEARKALIEIQEERSSKDQQITSI